MEERAGNRKVEDLTLRLLNKRRRREHPKYKAKVINYINLKESNLGYLSYEKGLVEEWSTNWEQPTTTTVTHTMKPAVEEGRQASRRILKPRRRKMEIRLEMGQMDVDVGRMLEPIYPP